MKTKKIFIFFLVFIIAASISYSFQANSSNYKLSTGIVSSGGEIVNSSNYKSYVATGVIAGITNSSSYKNWLGFFYTWLLANGQPCTSASQCEGGYCCSNLCSSSTCPVEEAAVPAAGAPGVGVGVGVVPRVKDFIIIPSIVKTKVALGESYGLVLVIINTGRDALDVSLTLEGVKGYFFLSDSIVHVEVGERAEVILTFTGKEVGSFTGEIIASADGVEQSIPIIFEVISEKIIFDVQIDIPAAYTKVEPGDDLKAQITVLSVGISENVDVFATYFIKDLRGNIIYEETELITVEKQISYPKSFKIPEDAELGSHVAIVEVRYADSFAVSSQLFEVVEKKVLIGMEKITKNTTLMIFLTFLLVIIISMLIYKLVSIRKSRNRET